MTSWLVHVWGRLRALASRWPSRTAWRVTLAAMAGWYVIAFLYVAARRMGYPYDVEWMEGGIHEHVARVLEGKPLYVAPSLEFTPYIYTPLYYWLCAPLLALFGPGLPVLRAVSLLCTLGLFAVLFALVHRSTRDRLCAWVAVGTFAACFELGGAWFDLARVDMLGLLLAALALLVMLRSERHDWLVGVLFALSFLAKQSALVVALPVMGARLLTQRGLRRVHAPLTFGALFALSTVVLDRASGGWYRFYVFELPASHPIAKEAWWGFWRNDVFAALPFATAGLVFMLAQPRSWRSAIERLAITVGMLGTAWSSRLHTGGYSNVLLPELFLLSWALAEALHTWTAQEAVPAAPSDAPPPPRSQLRFAYALCALQLVALWYPLSRQIPNRADRSGGDRMVERLRKTPGNVLVPFHGHLARLAGKPAHGHEMAFRDVMLGRSDLAKLLLKKSVKRALRDQRYGLIVLDEEWWQRELEAHYVRTDVRLWKKENTFQSRTGMIVGPKDWYVPQRAATARLRR